jgi:hypothetical protein
MVKNLREYLPFCWWNDLHDARLHSMLVDFIDEALEVAELIHCLHSQG